MNFFLHFIHFNAIAAKAGRQYSSQSSIVFVSVFKNILVTSESIVLVHTSYDSGRSYSVGNTHKLVASYPSGPGDTIKEYLSQGLF